MMPGNLIALIYQKDMAVLCRRVLTGYFELIFSKPLIVSYFYNLRENIFFLFEGSGSEGYGLNK